MARAAARSLGLAALLGSCVEPAPSAQRRAAQAQESAASESVFLGEWLELNGARCRVDAAEHSLTEAREVAERGRVSPDVRAVAVYTRCEGRTGEALSLDNALPRDTLIFLRDVAGVRRAPSERTKLSSMETPPLVFEFAASEASPLPPARSFDATTGQALYEGQREPPRLSLEAGGARREVVLCHRAEGPELERWLRSLVTALSAPALPASSATPPVRSPDLERAHGVYRRLLPVFMPMRLSLTQLTANGDGSLRLTLELERPRLANAPNPVAMFHFELTPQAGAFRDARLVEVSDGSLALSCVEGERALTAQAERTLEGAKNLAGRCNVLGLNLPIRCEQLDPELKEKALALRSRCVRNLEGVLGQPLRAAAGGPAAPVPEDFQFTLRRGKPLTGFDHGARYVLAMFGNGSVVFHGRSFVNDQGRSDGRTSRAMVGRVFAHLKELDWFGRKGGVWHAEGCSPEDDRGDVFTLQAGGRQRMVLDRDGCRGPFSSDELRGLRLLVLEASGAAGWTTPGTASEPERVSEWIVNAD
jgi:hypothetical protein